MKTSEKNVVKARYDFTSNRNPHMVEIKRLYKCTSEPQTFL